MVFHVDIKKACKRKYLPNGEEVEPDFGSKQKVNTGHLMSSYSKNCLWFFVLFLSYCIFRYICTNYLCLIWCIARFFYKNKPYKNVRLQKPKSLEHGKNMTRLHNLLSRNTR